MPRHVDADGQAEEAVEPAHPLGVAPRQVVVDGDHVHALAGERVQVDRQRRHQRLAFAGAHLGDLALVQRHAADELHVEVAHLQRALAGLRAPRRRLRAAARRAIRRRSRRWRNSSVLARSSASSSVSNCGSSALTCVDASSVGLQQAVVPAAEYLGQDLGKHAASGLGGTEAQRRTRCRSAGCGAGCRLSGAIPTVLQATSRSNSVRSLERHVPVNCRLLQRSALNGRARRRSAGAPPVCGFSATAATAATAGTAAAAAFAGFAAFSGLSASAADRSPRSLGIDRTQSAASVKKQASLAPGPRPGRCVGQRP